MLNRFLIIAFILISCVATAQDPYHIIYGIEDGLPSEEAYDVYVDADDYVWVTTDRGVSRYNGYEFENFNTSDGLAYNTNFKIFPDHLGRLWFLGFDESISIYENGQFRKLEFSHKISRAQYSQHNNYLYGLAHDSLGNIYTHFSGKSSRSALNAYYKLVNNGEVIETLFKDECIAEIESGELCIKKIDLAYNSFIYIHCPTST